MVIRIDEDERIMVEETKNGVKQVKFVLAEDFICFLKIGVARFWNAVRFAVFPSKTEILFYKRVGNMQCIINSTEVKVNSGLLPDGCISYGENEAGEKYICSRPTATPQMSTYSYSSINRANLLWYGRFGSVWPFSTQSME